MTVQLGRTTVDYLTNKSGGAVAYGDVVVVDLSNAAAFTTTTSSGYTTSQPGVCLEKNGIANNASGIIAFGGPVGQINLNASASLGDFVKCHSVAKQGTPHNAPRTTGDFAEVKGTGTTPAALLFGNTYVSASGNVATDSIWDAKGDLAGGTGADTAAKLTVGANGTQLQADSTQTTGLKWSDVGTLLGYNVYTSGTFASLSSTSMADVDATNMKVVFAAPVSGNVLVRLTATTQAGLAGAADIMFWGLRESTTDIAGPQNVSRGRIDASTSLSGARSVAFVLTGLSGGSHTYKWSYKVSAGTGAIYAASDTPAVMEVWAL